MPGGFGCKEWLEDAGLDFFRNPRAIIHDLNNDTVSSLIRSDLYFTLAIHRVIALSMMFVQT